MNFIKSLEQFTYSNKDSALFAFFDFFVLVALVDDVDELVVLLLCVLTAELCEVFSLCAAGVCSACVSEASAP